jgi:hypothetical protein
MPRMFIESKRGVRFKREERRKREEVCRLLKERILSRLRKESGPIGLGFLANPNPYGPARVKPENLTEFSDAKNPYTIPN